MAIPSAQARREAAHLARLKLSQQPLYLDTETTGLGLQDEILEVCLLDADGKPLLETLVRPTQPIPRDAALLHGITDEMVRGAPPWPEVWPQLQTLMGGRLVAVYNAEFDTRLMDQSHIRHGMTPPPSTSEFLCLMLLYARFRGEWDASRRSFRWHSLETARRQAGLSLPNTHRAREDALLARLLLHHMAKNG